VQGINYYFICEARRMYPGSKPYAVMMCINVFQDQTSVISIEVIHDELLCGGPLGEWP